MNVQPIRSLNDIVFLNTRNVLLIVALVLFIKNVIMDKRPVFTVLMNLFFIILSIFYKNGGYVFIINVIATLLFGVLKIKKKMKRGISYLILILIMPLISFVLTLGMKSSADILLEGEALKREIIREYTIGVSTLLIQVNLIVSYINANWDCFKKKSGEILDSKE